MTLHLREYQRQALDALATHRREHPDETRLAVQMATGLGKTITFAHEAVEALTNWEERRTRRVLVLVHTDELAQQAAAKVNLVAGNSCSVGIVKAERNDVIADIIIGSVQTLANPARRTQLHDVGLIIVDECHHAVASTYQAILKHLGAMCACWTSPDNAEGPLRECPEHGDGSVPAVPVTGYTATLERGDGAALGHVWQDVVFTRDISWAVRKGYLVPPVGYTVTVPMTDLPVGSWLSELPGVPVDPHSVRVSGLPSAKSMAKMTDKALDSLLVDSIAPERVVESWIEHAKGRSTVLFAPLVRSARAFADAFHAQGVGAAVVHGAMPASERRMILAMYARGVIDVVCNAMVLTEGWDVPRTKCVIWARPTTSRPLFIQGVGRGLRPWLDGPIPRSEQDCVLLVVSDSTPGLTSIADLSTRPIEAADGKSLLTLEDEYDLSTDLEPDAPNAYAGQVDVREFDPLVARSAKVWQKTKGGALFVPCGREVGYIAILPDTGGYAVAALHWTGRGERLHRYVPDLELAMSLAEDEATERGGDFGRLIADKTRPWRKAVPSAEMQAMARSLGLGAELDRIMAERRGGKAGRLSDTISIVKASRLIDPVVEKLRKAGA